MEARMMGVLLEELTRRLSGETRKQDRITLDQLELFLRGKNPWPAPVTKSRCVVINGHTFPIWMTIQIGGKTPEQLMAELEKKGFKIGDWARHMMKHENFTVLSEPREIDLVRIAPEDLEFPKGAKTKQFWDKGRGFGLKLCLAETGPHLRLAYGDQPKDEWVCMAMEPIVGSFGDPGVFEVGHGDAGLWLDCHRAHPGDGWDPGARIVFSVPRE